MESSIVFSKNGHFLSNCTADPNNHQITCNDGLQSQSFSLDCKPDKSCTFSNDYNISTNSDQAFLIFDIPYTSRLSNVQIPTNLDNDIIVEAEYKTPYGDVQREVKRFTQKANLTAYQAYKIWFDRHENNIQTIKYTIIKTNAPTKIQPIPFTNIAKEKAVAQIDRLVNNPQAFILFTPQGIIRSDSIDPLIHLLNKQPDNVTQDIFMIHVRNRSQKPQLIVGKGWAEIKSYVGWIASVSRQSVIKDTYLQIVQKPGNSIGMEFRIGPTTAQMEWTKNKEYALAAVKKSFPPEFREDAYKAVQAGSGPTEPRFWGILGEANFFPWHRALGIGMGGSYHTNEGLRRYSVQTNVKVDLGEFLWKNPIISLVASYHAGWNWVSGEDNRASQLTSNPHNVSGSGFFHGTSIASPIEKLISSEDWAVRVTPQVNFWQRGYNTLSKRLGVDVGRFDEVQWVVSLGLAKKQKKPFSVTEYRATKMANLNIPYVAGGGRPVGETRWPNPNIMAPQTEKNTAAESDPYRAPLTKGLDVNSWLDKPGVKMLAVDFYMNGCIPCKEESPRWQALRERHEKDGVRFVVVKDFTNNSCAKLSWTPDKEYCDDENSTYAKTYDVTKYPSSLLWNWQRKLLVQNGRVANVEQKIKSELIKAPRVAVISFDQTGENLVALVRAELAQIGKINIVADAKEQAALEHLRKESNNLRNNQKYRCSPGNQLPSNSMLVVKVMGLNSKQLILELQNIETGCALASGKSTLNLSNSSQGVKAAAIDLIENLRRPTLQMPSTR